jgi:hypothetical protein
MTSRSALDKPATALAIAFGVLLMVPGGVMAYLTYPSTASGTFDVQWRQDHAEMRTLLIPSESGTYRSEFTVANALVSSVQMDPSGACTDTYRATVQQPATLTYKITRTVGGHATSLKDGTYTCATRDGAKQDIQVNAHPDVGSRDGADAASATRSLWTQYRSGNETATYTLEVSANRPAGTVPTSNLASPTSLTASVQFMVQKWVADLTPHQAAVGK